MTGLPCAERLTEAETEAFFVLRKYHVHKHHRATSEAKAPRYAIFLKGGIQISEPVTHAEAKTQADILIVKEIARHLAAGHEARSRHPIEESNND